MTDPPIPSLSSVPSTEPETPAPLPGGTSSGWWPRLKIFAAGLGSILLAAAYASLEFGHTPLLGMRRDGMARLMQMEVLVISAFPFVAFFALARPSALRWRVLQWCAFWTLLGLFINGAWLEGKWWGILTYAGLTFATYMGFLLHLTGGAQILRLVLRWLISFTVLMILWGAMHMPEPSNTWNQAPGVYRFGFLYFLTLGLVEWTGVYQGRWIDRMADQFRRNPSE